MATIPEALAIAAQHHQAGRYQAAERIYREILQLNPSQPDANHLLGMLAHQFGRHDVAIDCIGRAIGSMPLAAGYHFDLGCVYAALGRNQNSINSYRRAVDLRPDFPEAQNELGNALYKERKIDEAVICYRKALHLKPEAPGVYNNLGNALREQGQFDEAIACYQKAVELKPDFAGAHNDLGVAYKEYGKIDEAIGCFRRALAVNADSVDALNNLGVVLAQDGQLDEAARCYRLALKLDPRAADVHSNLVYAELFDPGRDAPTLLEEHRRWARAHEAPLAKLVKPHVMDCLTQRRLRVGYISPDFRDHVIGRNVFPVIREHDREKFEVFCYSDVFRSDAMTQRFSDCSCHWREISGKTDETVAALIRGDGIDILVDLTLHMAFNRLLVFARQPAPVQVTFAGYPGTTGLSSIQYRLTDPHLNPPGRSDAFYSETSVRLPSSFWCYDPVENGPDVNELPAKNRRFVTFGCLNNPRKINSLITDLWPQILRVVDGSRLLLLESSGTRNRMLIDFFEANGVSRDRIGFVPKRPHQEYLKYYHEIDIALDTVPYNGHTTSLDSLWMGTPVVSLVGSTVVGRAGLSQLFNLGLPELVTYTSHEYIAKVIELASDLPYLGELRSTLRDQMRRSPIMDAPRFTRSIEAAYSEIWRRHRRIETSHPASS